MEYQSLSNDISANYIKAHIIRNRKSKVFHAVAALQSRHRWCLTGTPIQNSVDDLGSLVGFLGISPFENASKFRNTFTTPIQKDDPRGWERLTSLIKAISLRRTKDNAISLNLPPRYDFTQPVALNEREKAIYDAMLRFLSLGLSTSSASLFQTILRLRQICDAPALLPTAIQEWMVGALKSADTPTSKVLAIHTCEWCHRDVQGSDHDRPGTPKDSLSCFHLICDNCLVKNGTLEDIKCPICSGDTAPRQVIKHCSQKILGDETSSKIEALLNNLIATRNDEEDKQVKR